MLDENSILKDRMSNIQKRMTIAELLGISGRFKHRGNDKDDDSKYLSQLLLTLNEMISELARFKRLTHYNKEKNRGKSKDSSSTGSLFHFLEKNLLEISYISDKEKRQERIKKLYDWFKAKQKYKEDIRNITTKTYKEKGEIEEQEALLMKTKNYKETIINDSDHRNLELINKKMLNEYERKRLRGPSWALSRLSSSHSLPRLSIFGKDSNLDTFSMFSGNDLQINDLTTLYSSIYGTNSYTKKNYDNEIPTFIDKPEGGLLEKDYISSVFYDNNSFLPLINKEAKYSYSFLRPTYNFNEVYLENKIIESKQKELALKRAREEIKEKVKEYGLNRARYKENINNKYELKSIINMYVNRNKLKSPLLKKYKKKNKNEELEKKNVDIIYSNIDDIKNKMDNLKIINSISNINSPSRSSPTQKNSNSNLSEKNNKEIKSEISLSKGIIKNDSRFYKEINKVKSAKKISFSYSQKIKVFNLKEEKEEKMNESFSKSNKSIPKRTFSFRKKTKIPKKRSSSQISYMSGFRLSSFNNNKVKTDKIQNLDIKSKNIIDTDNTESKKYEVSLPKEKINSGIINVNKNLIGRAPDTITHVLSNYSLIKEKMIFDNICNIKSNISQDNDVLIYSNLPKNELENNNFCLSAFNKENIKKINKSINLKKPINLKKKYHLEKLNEKYNLYKHNFLKMRRYMSNEKKKEYNYLADKLRTRKINEIYYNDDYDDEIEDENGDNNSNLINVSFKNPIGLKKNNSLLEAIVNPNDNLIYSRYYLPRNGSMLLSREDQSKKLLK